ncbi:MAG: serine racemase VanT catalytic subunit [Selenomonadaceae bacterium]
MECTSKLIFIHDNYNSIIYYTVVCVLSCTFAVILENLLAKGKVNKLPFPCGRAWIEIDKNSLRQNVSALRTLLPSGSQLMPAIKANAYGHGAVLLAKELNKLGITAFCVATVLEGVELRNGGVKGDILILGYTHPKQFSLLKKYHLTQTVIDSGYAKTLNAYGKKIKVQLKIDTGMHRMGERAEREEEICSIFHCKNLIITGAYTHLCCDETTTANDAEFTKKQGDKFYSVVSDLEKRGYSCGKLHLLASYGLINYPEFAGDYVRIGIALYGVLSNKTDLNYCPVELHPVLSIKARVALTKDLFEGEGAGYGLQYVAKQDRKIAVLTIGYADGIPRTLSCGHGKVLINQNEAPIIGRICMDQTLIDITDVPCVKPGDIAVVIGVCGNKEITAYDLAEASGTITNELLSRLGSRLNRVLV